MFGQADLIRIFAARFEHRHESRTRLSLDRHTQVPCEFEQSQAGRVIAIALRGGLRHQCMRTT